MVLISELLFINYNGVSKIKYNKNKVNLLICTGGVNAILFAFSSRINIICIVVAMVFTIFCFLYSSIFEVKTKYLSWVGVNSFKCYLFHLLAIYVLQGLISFSIPIFVMMVFIVTFLLICIYTILIDCIILNKFVKHS